MSDTKFSELSELAGADISMTADGFTVYRTVAGDAKRMTPNEFCRIPKRRGSTTSSATPTINTDNYDVYALTAQAADITSFTTNLSGTPNPDQDLLIEITGTDSRAITWGASFASTTVALPTSTVSTETLRVAFLYNSTTSQWDCVGVC